MQLVEIPTDDETYDNIVAYWAPKEEFKAGEHRTLRYRLSWLDEIPVPRHTRRGRWARGRASAAAPGRITSGGRAQVRHRFSGQAFAALAATTASNCRQRVPRDRCQTSTTIRSSIRSSAGAPCSTSRPSATEPVDLRAFPSQGQAGADRDLDLPVLPRPDLT